MPLDPRIILQAGQGVTPPRDPLQTMGAVYALQGAQQEQQVRQLQLDAAQRAEFERQNLGQALRGTMTTDPATGQPTVNMAGALGRAYATSRDPLALLKVETEYGQSQAESRKAALEARKLQLEQMDKQLGVVSQLANGVLQVEAQGGDVETAYQRAIQQVAGIVGPNMMRGIPPTYDRAYVQQMANQGVARKDQLTLERQAVADQIRAAELEETKQRTAIEREGLGIRREDVAVRREDVVERRAERQQTRESTAQQRVGDREKDLRSEFNALTKDYRTVVDAYGRIQSAQETGPGDISLIFSYMKLLDPASTVREGEFATAQNAGGVPERLIAQYNRLISGERLAPETRKQFLQQAEDLYGQATRGYQRTRTQYEDMARRYGADPANVTLEYRSTETPRTGGGTTKPLPTTKQEALQEIEQLERQLQGQ